MGQGKRIGYIRVSTTDQNPDRQLEGVQLDKKFVDYASGKNKKRPQLDALMDYVREDDEIFVHSIDRLARNSKDLFELVENFLNKKIVVHFVKNNLVFNGNDSPMSKFQLSIMAAYAEFEREILLERQREGIAIARKAGKYKGGKTKMTPDKISQLEEMLKTREPKSKIALALGVSRFTLYRYLEKIQPAAASEEQENERLIQQGI